MAVLRHFLGSVSLLLVIQGTGGLDVSAVLNWVQAIGDLTQTVTHTLSTILETTGKQAVSAKDKLLEGLSSTEIDKAEVNKAERELKGDVVKISAGQLYIEYIELEDRMFGWENLDEKTDFGSLDGITESHLDEHIDMLGDTLDLSEKLIKQLKAIKYSGEARKMVEEISYEAGSPNYDNVFVFLTKTGDNRFSSAYVKHEFRATFELREMEVVKRKKLMGVTYSSTEDTEYEPVKFTLEDITGLKLFCYHRALVALYQKGIIQQIPYRLPTEHQVEVVNEDGHNEL